MNTQRIHELSARYFDSAIRIRREIHRYPELAFEEKKTSETIINELNRIGLDYEVNIAETGIVAVINGAPGERSVLIRADMDALPIREDTGLPFASINDGKMHACGHDAHVASALLAGQILLNLKDYFCGSVYFVFQPAEEGDGGAKPMIDAGILSRYPATAAIAGHMMPEIPVGSIRVKSGPIMASPDDFEVTFYGKGGHGASPETAINPIEMGRDFVSLTDVISREISKENIPCVISICSFHSGSCRNAIPETAVISGTFRTLTPESRKQTAERIKQATEQIAQKYGGEFSLDLNLLYPPTINDPNMTNALIASSRELFGERNVLIGKHASMCGDDFAYFAEQIPSVYFHVGCGDNARCAPIHSPHFDLNEEAIRIAAETYVQFVLNYLSK